MHKDERRWVFLFFPPALPEFATFVVQDYASAMKIRIAAVCFVFVSCWLSGQNPPTRSKRLTSSSEFQKCLPADIKLNDVCSITGTKKSTVQDKLTELDAKCEKGKLKSAKGRPIAFYKMQGCWGNPPADYRQIMAEQQRKI